jgi:mannose-6-phosphate isomerase-like protein (cupin superfamily)
MYERLGYRTYSGGFTLASGLYRIPMILVVADAAHLARVHPAFSGAIHTLAPTGDVDLAYKLLPELRAPPLCAHSAPEALAYVCGLYRNSDAEQSIPTEAARSLCRAALLRLRAGETPIHAGDKPLLWFVLSGTCEVTCKDGGKLPARAGYGINAWSGCSFTALEDADVLIFGNHDPFDGMESVSPAALFWKKILAAKKKLPG